MVRRDGDAARTGIAGTLGLAADYRAFVGGCNGLFVWQFAGTHICPTQQVINCGIRGSQWHTLNENPDIRLD